MACHLFGPKPLSEPIFDLLSNGPLGARFNEIRITIIIFAFKQMQMSSAKWRPFCPGKDESKATFIIRQDMSSCERPVL